jgi:hypothetical protein
MKRASRRFFVLGSCGLFTGLLAGVVAMFVTGAYSSGFSGADESAHFLNSYFFSSYLKGHIGANPLAFATEFYVHYPKISIGHWPPAYYGVVGVLFLVIPATVENAFLINLLFSSLPVAAVAIALGHLVNYRAALVGAAVYALTPLVTEGQAYFMLDQVLAAICIAATMAWWAYTITPAWWRALLLAALCTFAILTKGNGWLLVFVPVYHMLLTQSWRLLKLPHVYGAALVAGSIVFPWYWLTSGIAADGFNYQAGLHYALTAFSSAIRHLVDNVSLPGVLLATLAVVVEFRQRRQHPARWSVISACLSLVLATLTLQCLVPVDIVARYMAPALPAVSVLTIIGLHNIYTRLLNRGFPSTSMIAMLVLAAFMFVPGVIHLVERVEKTNYQVAKAIPLLATNLPHNLCLIDGVSNAEGAFMAEMALQDPDLRHYAIRASKLFADTNFMGTRYAPRFMNPEAVLAEIKRLGIHNVIIVRAGGQLAFPHSQQLADALQLPGSAFQRVAVLSHGGRLGTTEVYESTVQIHPDLDAVRQMGIPAKVSTVIKPQP